MVIIPNRIVELIALYSQRSSCLAECHALVSRNLVGMIEGCPGVATTREALETWTIRKQTTAQACIETHGFEHTLEQLGRRAPGEQLLLYGLNGSHVQFVLFVDATQSDIVGCIRVRRSDAGS